MRLYLFFRRFPLQISNKFWDLSLMHWPRGKGGGSGFLTALLDTMEGQCSQPEPKQYWPSNVNCELAVNPPPPPPTHTHPLCRQSAHPHPKYTALPPHTTIVPHLPSSRFSYSLTLTQNYGPWKLAYYILHITYFTLHITYYIFSTFLGPKWHSPNGSMPFHRGPKSLLSRARPPTTCPRNGSGRIKNIIYIYIYFQQTLRTWLY